MGWGGRREGDGGRIGHAHHEWHMPALDTPAMHTPCRRGLLGLNRGEREREQACYLACYFTNLQRKEDMIPVELVYGHINKGLLF